VDHAASEIVLLVSVKLGGPGGRTLNIDDDNQAKRMRINNCSLRPPPPHSPPCTIFTHCLSK